MDPEVEAKYTVINYVKVRFVRVPWSMNRAMSLRVVKKPIAPNMKKNAGMENPTMFSPGVGPLIPSGNTRGPNIIGTKLATTPTNPPPKSDMSVPFRGVMYSSPSSIGSQKVVAPA